jgi:ferredoxin-NADP reductase
VKKALFTVRRIDRLSEDVKEFEFAPADQRQPPWAHPPGAHIVVETPAGANPYSLTGDGIRPTTYRISVRRVGDHGGSAWLHDRFEVGASLNISAPISAFAPVSTARHHLLIAAGIGITPILAHVRAARQWGRSFEVVYGHAEGRAPHRDELAALAGSRLIDATGRSALAATLADALRRQPVGTHAYVCGPGAMLDAFVDLASRSGWPEERVHIERFAAPELGPGKPFTLLVPDLNLRLDVPAGMSALRALDNANVRLPRLCEQGVCGQCRLSVVAGIPEHRDLILSKHERSANDCFYPCVSRSLSPALEVSLP